MSQPVTTNPLIIMLINITVVFLVLTALGLVIKFIHYVDPTRSRTETKKAAPEPAPVLAAVPVSPQPEEEGISPEVIAVIAAAVASYGYGVEQIQAIRPIERNGWKNSARSQLSRM